MRSVAVTARQADYLVALLQREVHVGEPATIRELAALCGVTMTAAFQAVRRLQREGLATNPPWAAQRPASRTLRLTEAGRMAAFAAICLDEAERPGSHVSAGWRR